MKLNILLLCFSICFNVKIRANKMEDFNLQLVQVLFRHGERTPLEEEIKLYNISDPSLYEPYGLEQLTNNGKLQEYKIGAMLRRQYDGFLSSKYESNDLYAQSSTDIRTLESLQLVLAGLYPPIPELMWNKNLPWLPIAFNYPLTRDAAILFKQTRTTRYLKLLKETTYTPEYIEKVAKYSDFLNFFKNETGITIDPHEVFDIIQFFTPLHINERMKLPLPSWYKDEVKDNLYELVKFAMDSIAFTRKLTKLFAGPLVKSFLDNMNIDNTYVNPRKIYLYSGHDSNLAGFLKAHKVLDMPYIEFGSALILEKWKHNYQNSLYVRLLFWDGASEQLLPLRIADCKEYCPMNEYLKVINDVIPSNEEITNLLSDTCQSKNIYHDVFYDQAIKKRN